MSAPSLSLHRAQVLIHPDAQQPGGDAPLTVYAELIGYHHPAAVQLSHALAMAWALHVHHVMVTLIADEGRLLQMSTLAPSAGDARLLQLGTDAAGQPVWARPDRTVLLLRSPWLRRITDAQRAVDVWQRTHTELHSSRPIYTRRQADRASA